MEDFIIPANNDRVLNYEESLRALKYNHLSRVIDSQTYILLTKGYYFLDLNLYEKALCIRYRQFITPNDAIGALQEDLKRVHIAENVYRIDCKRKLYLKSWVEIYEKATLQTYAAIRNV